MIVVPDASALVALLLDDGTAGEWVEAELDGHDLAAPALVTFETANILRRREAAGLIRRGTATCAHDDLLAMRMQLWSYRRLGARVWSLRANVTNYDASYVAVAELVDGPLITLDERLRRAPGPRCEVRTP